MHSHSLVKVAHMLHKVHPTIVYGERWLGKSLRKSPSLDFACEGWFGDLVECSTHCVIFQAFGRWTSVSTLVMDTFIVRERLTGRNPRLSSVNAILFIINRRVRNGWSSFSSLVTRFSLEWSIYGCKALVSSLWERWLAFHDWLLLMRVVWIRTSQSLLHFRLTKWSSRWDPMDFAWCGLDPTIVAHQTHYNTRISHRRG